MDEMEQAVVVESVGDLEDRETLATNAIWTEWLRQKPCGHMEVAESIPFLARAAIAALDIDRIEREAYLRGWNEASKESSEEIRDIERQARWEAQDAYHQGQSDGRDW